MCNVSLLPRYSKTPIQGYKIVKRIGSRNNYDPERFLSGTNNRSRWCWDLFGLFAKQHGTCMTYELHKNAISKSGPGIFLYADIVSAQDEVHRPFETILAVEIPPNTAYRIGKTYWEEYDMYAAKEIRILAEL